MYLLPDINPENIPIVTIEDLKDSVRIIRETHFDTKVVHDPDFEFFRGLGQDKIFCDIGANIGNTINTLTGLGSRAAIHSFEINPVLYDSIVSAMELYPSPAKLHKFGLSEARGSFWLYIPQCNKVSILGEATMRLEYLLLQDSLDRLRSYTTDGVVSVNRIEVKVQPFDELGIFPHYIKIDVEGAEARVLGGMLNSIRASQPIIMLENSFQDEIDALMLNVGYTPWGYDPAGRRLLRRPVEGFQNTFYLPDARISALQMEGRLSVG